MKVTESHKLTEYTGLSKFVRRYYYAPRGEEVEILKSRGLYNRNYNEQGLVRDHIFPICAGYKLGVFPELMRHTANCSYIPFMDNSRKSARDRESDTWITKLIELFNRILYFGTDWVEQRLCYQLMKDYRNGDRYKFGQLLTDTQELARENDILDHPLYKRYGWVLNRHEKLEIERNALRRQAYDKELVDNLAKEEVLREHIMKLKRVK